MFLYGRIHHFQGDLSVAAKEDQFVFHENMIITLMIMVLLLLFFSYHQLQGHLDTKKQCYQKVDAQA